MLALAIATRGPDNRSGGIHEVGKIVPLGVKHDVLATRLTDIQLSTPRLTKRLHNLAYQFVAGREATVEDLLRMRPVDFRRSKGMKGEVGKEIEQWIKDRGGYLGMLFPRS